MCLSIAYKNKVAPENVLMKNVVTVESDNGSIILTDLMDRKMSVKGDIKIAALTDAYLVIEEK
jgi:predicted RNA-binding protein